MPAKRRILCVEDDPDASALIQTILGLTGYDVVPAWTLAEGRSLAAAEHFALIVVKERFADGRGVDFVRGLRAMGCTVPIILHSDDVSEASGREARGAGVDLLLLLKPSDPGELALAVRRLTAGR
jgi:DNA-binding response OmpR family regulator